MGNEQGVLSNRVLIDCTGGCFRFRSRLPGRLTNLALGILLLIAFRTTVVAQTSQATLRGNITDSSHAVVIGASLVLENVETHIKASTISNSAGDYLFQNITPGTYTVLASQRGFTAQRVKPFSLGVNQATTIDFVLPVGQVNEIVEVTAVGEGVESSTTELGSTLQTEQIGDLPLNGRNFTNLFTTVPGVSTIVVGGSQTNSYNVAIGAGNIIPSVHGQTNRSDLFVVDGLLDIETFGDAYAVQPVIDIIQDQKLQSHNDSAEFGGSTGGTINISTKSGTNSLHGSAWEFNKTGALQALGYFTPAGSAQTQLTQNQYGFTLGGPVIIPKLYHGKNRTFFFMSYEGFNYNSPGQTIVTVPTASELTGDFTALVDSKGNQIPIYDPATTTYDPTTQTYSRTQFAFGGVPNMIDPARLSKGDIYYAQNTLPTIATTPVSGGNAYENSPSTNTFHEYDARGDENIGQNDSVFFRMMGARGNEGSGWTQMPSSLTLDDYQWVGSYVHIFSPISTLHFQIGRTYLAKNSATRYTSLPSGFATSAGIDADIYAPFLTGDQLVPGYNASGYFNQSESVNPFVTANHKGIKLDYTLVLGKHTLKTGAEFNKMGEGTKIEYADVSWVAATTSDLQGDNSGNSLASYMLGLPDNAIRRNSPESMGFGGVFSAYVQDSFQVSNKLTVNLGLHYDFADYPRFGTAHDNNQATGDFDFNNGTYVVLKNVGSCAVLKAAPCIPTPDGSLPDHVVLSQNDRVFSNTSLNLGPRVGIAYRLTPTTAIRSGFGIAFDEYAGMEQNDRGVAANWPSTGELQHGDFNTPTASNPFPDVTPQELPGLGSLPAATPFQNQNWYVDPKLKDAYSIQWNLGVQRQLNPATVATVTYVGSENHRMSSGGFWNTAPAGPGDTVARRPYPYMVDTYWARSRGSGNYHALEALLTRSFSHGLAATIAYTWSKSIDEGCSGFFGSEGCDQQQPTVPKADRAVSAYDVPQHLAATWNYELPIGRGKMLDINNRALNMIAGGWQVNGILTLVSGTPYAVHTSKDIANVGVNPFDNYERMDVTGSTVPSSRNAQNWFNTAAFTYPALYTFGNMGRDSIRTQFYSNVDVSLFKELKFEHGMSAQIRAEAFNLPNQHVFGQPDSTFEDPNFGVINSTANSPRSIQLGGKFIF